MDASYCPRCGQKDVDLHRPLVALLGEVLRETFEVDGRAARTVKTLFLAPGRLTSEFLAGHRRRYTPPFRLYLVISVVFFVIITWAASRGALVGDGPDAQGDASRQAQFISDRVPSLMFVLVPVFAALLKAAFRSRLYFEHLIHALHLHSAAFVRRCSSCSAVSPDAAARNSCHFAPSRHRGNACGWR